MGKWLADEPALLQPVPPKTETGPTPWTTEDLAQIQLTWDAESQHSETLELKLYNRSTLTLESLIVEVAADLSDSPLYNPSVPPEKVADFRSYVDGAPSSVREKYIRPDELVRPRKYRASRKAYADAGPLRASHWTVNLGFDPHGFPLLVKVLEATGTKEEAPTIHSAL